MAKNEFLEGYETYDPEEEGYGHPTEWRDTFFERMGLEKARRLLGARDPLKVIGIQIRNPTWAEISNAFRKIILKLHPDLNPDNEEALAEAKEAIAAYEILEDRYGVKE